MVPNSCSYIWSIPVVLIEKRLHLRIMAVAAQLKPQLLDHDSFTRRFVTEVVFVQAFDTPDARKRGWSPSNEF